MYVFLSALHTDHMILDFMYKVTGKIMFSENKRKKNYTYKRQVKLQCIPCIIANRYETRITLTKSGRKMKRE